MKDAKKVWSKPELIVLVRSNPEEAVLSACKRGGRDGPYITEDGKGGKCNQNPTIPGGMNVHCHELSNT